MNALLIHRLKTSRLSQHLSTFSTLFCLESWRDFQFCILVFDELSDYALVLPKRLSNLIDGEEVPCQGFSTY